MAQQVDVKGFGLVEFPDGISRETMLQALQRRFSQMPTNESGATAAPYTPSLSERAASGVSNVLQRTGLISNPYQANRIGGNVETALNFLPVIGDAIGGDDLGRAIAQGDAGDIGFAALGAIPIAGDAVKGARKIKLFHGTNADFDDFDTSKIGSASDPGIRGRGFYFTPNKKTAESYGDKIKEVEVEVENPLDLQQFSSAKEVSEYLGVPENIIRFRVDKLPSGEFKSVSVSPNYTGSFTSAIKDKGHDAVIHGQEVVIFNPDKIKTLKTYDKLNPQQNPLTQVGGAGKALNTGVKGALSRFSDSGVQSAIREREDLITLDKVIVPKDQRGTGIGTDFMQSLLRYSDENGVPVALTPSADFGGNKTRLTEFYKRFGFVENKGKNKRYEISEAMYRDPQQ